MNKLQNIIKRCMTPKTLAVFMTVLYVSSLIPLFIIAKYNYPSADDYSIGETCRHAWAESHSIFNTIWQAMLMAWEDYFHWMGYFSSIFFMSIHPGVFGERWYAATTYIMVGSISFGTMYIMNALCVKALKMNKSIIHSITMMLLFVTVQNMVGRNEALYWYCGAVNYTFMHGLSLFFYGGLLSAVFDKTEKRRKWGAVIASVCGFIIGAGNYMTALNVCIIMIVVFAIWGVSQNAKLRQVFRLPRCFSMSKKVWIPSCFFFLSFLLSVIAPGNSVRSEGATGMNPIKAVFVSFYYCLDYCLGEWSNWVVLLLIVMVIILGWNAAGHTEFTFPYPLLAVVLGFCLVSAMITPPMFAVGNIGAGRLKAIIYMMYILVLVLSVLYVTGWVRKRLCKDKWEGFTWNSACGLLTCILFFAFGSVLCIIPDSHYYTFTSAITDLANGDAQSYGKALEERAEILNVQGEENIVLDALPVQPKLLYFGDITTDENAWENKAMARYYKKKTVRIK